MENIVTRKISSLDNLIIGLSFILLVFHTLTFLQIYYKFIITCFLYAGILFLVLLKKDFSLNTKVLFWLAMLVIAAVLVCCISAIKEYSIKQIIGQYVPYFIWGSLYFIVAPILSGYKRKRYIGLFLITVAISVIATLLVVIVDNDAARLLAGAASEEERYIYYRKGVGGYGFIYGCVFLLFGLLLWYRELSTKTAKILTVLLIVLTCLMVLFASYTTAFLFILIIFFLWYMTTSKKRNVGTLLIIALILFLFRVQILKVLQSFAIALDLSWIDKRLGQLIEAMTTGNVSNLTRYELYMRSLKSFMANPLIGEGEIGGHSFLLDLMGKFGSSGIIFFICVCMFIMQIAKTITNRKKWIYILFAIFMCIDTVDSISCLPIILFLLPMMLTMEKNKSQDICSC